MTTLLKLATIIRWRQLFQLRLLLAGLFVFGLLGVGGLLALRTLRPAAPVQILPGQTLAWDIARATASSPDIELSSGAYVPGDTLLLYTRTTQTDRMRVRTWAVMQLEPFADRLAQMPSHEKLTWVIDFGPAPVEQEVLQVALNHADDPTLYNYTSAAPELLVASESTLTALPARTSLPSVASAPTNVAASPVASIPTTMPVPTVAPDSAPGQETLLLRTGFDEQEGGQSIWRPLSGEWEMQDGVYSQRVIEGYDYISMLDLPPRSHYLLEVKLRLVEGEMGGGLIYNAPELTTRAGAQSVDFDNQGSFLRWGHYDSQGNYIYAGGTPVEPALNDGNWHTLRLVTHATESVVFLDGRELGTIANASTQGYPGLTTSQAQVDFDDIQVIALAGQSGTTAAIVTPPPPQDENFSDDFADGDARGWQVLNGNWQIVDGAYHQTSASGADLSSVSIFQSNSFTATVQLKRLGGDMGGGICFSMAERSSKARSQIVGYTQRGTVLQWGYFDEGGNFVFAGSAPVPDGGDGEWHTLTVSVRAGLARFILDDEQIAEDVTLTYTGGYVGLIASNSQVAFDDVLFELQ